MLDFKEKVSYICIAGLLSGSPAWFFDGMARPTGADPRSGETLGSGLPKPNKENLSKLRSAERCSKRVRVSYSKPLPERSLHASGRRGFFCLYNTLYVPTLRSATVIERHINQRDGTVRRLSSDALALCRPFKNSGTTVVSSVPGVETSAFNGFGSHAPLRHPSQHIQRGTPAPAQGVSPR